MSETVFEASFELALERARAVATKMPVETLFLASCAGRVVAHDVIAQSDMPPFHASKVDGWAVSGQGPWQIIGDITAGQRFDGELQSGECVHIATGAEMPEGTSAALRDEYSESLNGIVSISAHLSPTAQEIQPGTDVRPAGAEAAEGDVLIPAGTTLTPALIGLCAAAGYAALGVRRRMRATVLVLGDELVHEGTSGDGKVRDALGPQLPLWLNTLSVDGDDVLFVPDTLEALVLALRSTESDLVITTGSTAAGPEDHLHSAIKELGGSIEVDAVMMRPGYHTLFGTIGSRTILGLPGNPQSAVIGLLTIGQAIIDGANSTSTLFASRKAATEIGAPVKEVRIALCTELADGVKPVEHVDSSMLRGFVTADGFAIVPSGGVSAGDEVQWIALPRY